jgi:hypothetical protein
MADVCDQEAQGSQNLKDLGVVNSSGKDPIFKAQDYEMNEHVHATTVDAHDALLGVTNQFEELMLDASE